jgi:hypothetical protein
MKLNKYFIWLHIVKRFATMNNVTQEVFLYRNNHTSLNLYMGISGSSKDIKTVANFTPGTVSHV